MTVIAAVTFTPETGEMQALSSVLDDIADIRCIAGLDADARLKVLNQAEVVISRSFARAEMNAGDVAALKRTRLIHLLFAGANHVPFADLPQTAVVASNSGAFAGPLAEHVLGMTLCLAKKLLPGHAALAQRVAQQAFAFIRRQLRETAGEIVAADAPQVIR